MYISSGVYRTVEISGDRGDMEKQRRYGILARHGETKEIWDTSETGETG